MEESVRTYAHISEPTEHVSGRMIQSCRTNTKPLKDAMKWSTSVW